MEMKDITKQMIQFNKATFDNTFSAMTALQEQTEKMVNNLLEQNALMPAEGKKAVSDWLKSFKRGCEDFKALVDGNYKKVEEAFASFDKK
ncbi:hypothetical protein D4S03_04740 [bacterium]|nr:MAG: hypothetical protein D4S03_04740 [bacterium]